MICFTISDIEISLRSLDVDTAFTIIFIFRIDPLEFQVQVRTEKLLNRQDEWNTLQVYEGITLTLRKFPYLNLI